MYYVIPILSRNSHLHSDIFQKCAPCDGTTRINTTALAKPLGRNLENVCSVLIVYYTSYKSKELKGKVKCKKIKKPHIWV